jgi:hypothetical protein
MNPSEPQELLGPRLTKGEARPLENQAKRHYRAAGRNLARFAADLRRLQDGEAHPTVALTDPPAPGAPPITVRKDDHDHPGRPPA